MTNHLHLNRRHFVLTTAAGSGALLLPRRLWGAEPQQATPRDNPAAHLKLEWTNGIKWANVVDITTVASDEKSWNKRLDIAQQTLAEAGGGVVYFPAGEYQFDDHIKIAHGVILRGAAATGKTNAHDEGYQPATRFEFPQYNPTFSGDGTPISTAFKGIYLAHPATDSNCGIVNIDINRGHIRFEETADKKTGANRIVFGCVLRNSAVADPGVPSKKIVQHPWQRFTARHHAAIHVQSEENVLIANNRLAKSGDDNFTMKDFILKPNRGSKDRYNVVFDYDNRPGIYCNHHCIGGSGGSGQDGTPETHPWGFRKGMVIRDNYVYHTGRVGIGFTGDGTICSGNVTRIEKEVWRPTNDGTKATSGSSTNDNRAIEMRGWHYTVDGNDCVIHKNRCADRSYYINDGEGLMHEDHCNSDVRDSRITNNKINSYISMYKCGTIDGLLIAGNDVSVPSKIGDIFVVATRNTGPAPVRNVTIENNITRTGGIVIAGSPAENNIIRNNEHKGAEPGLIKNGGKAKLSGNKNYA